MSAKAISNRRRALLDWARGICSNRLPMTPRGWLACDPRGAQVAFDYGGRRYLGDVGGAYFDEVTGVTRLRVRHFNGESWPMDPPARSVEVLGP